MGMSPDLLPRAGTRQLLGTNVTNSTLGASLNASLPSALNSASLATNISTYEVNATLDASNDSEERLSPGMAILLMYTLLFLMLGAQTALFVWKKRHQKSYDLVTLFGLWLIPAIISLQLHFWRFLVIWALISAVTGYFLYSLTFPKKLDPTIPRKVYSFFLVLYRVSVFIGMTGYIMVICEMFGLGILFDLVLPKGTSFLMVWYGLYFGILGRDCAEVCSDRIGLMLGTGSRLTSTVTHCGICSNELKDTSHLGEASTAERCVQLSCKHCFHDLCIRGWTMIGKKDTCPVCLEKVDLREVYADRPWETRNLSWIQMLDAIRYMVVWNPIIFLFFSVIFHIFGPHHHHHNSALAMLSSNGTAPSLAPA